MERPEVKRLVGDTAGDNASEISTKGHAKVLLNTKEILLFKMKYTLSFLFGIS